MHESFRLGRIAGVSVGGNWSLLVIFWLITWSLAGVVLPDSEPGHAALTYWIAAIVTALLFFGCLLAHELSHAVVARRHGLEVEGITLWLFGGVARLGGDTASPRVELRIGLVGPVVSVLAGAAFALFAAIADALSAPDLLGAVASWLARINVTLGVFNLMPAYPLDGGRVLRAVLWRRHGEQVRATESAARLGELFAYGLIALGVIDVARGGSAGGLWFVFLGWFLLSAARSERSAVVLRAALNGIRVRDVMSTSPVVAPASMTIDDFLDRYALHYRFTSFPVVDAAGSVVGLVTLPRVKAVPPGARSTTTAGEVACPIVHVVTSAPSDPVTDLLDRLATSPEGRALVFEDGRLVGIVSAGDISRMLQVVLLRRGSLVAARPPQASPRGQVHHA